MRIERRLQQPWWLAVVVPPSRSSWPSSLRRRPLRHRPSLRSSRSGRFFDAAFLANGALSETVVSATPLIFTGLAAAVAFRMNLFNIGGEGQLYAGAITGATVGLLMAGAPSPVVVAGMIAAGAAGGALLAAIPGVLRAYFSTSEILTSLMLNYVVGVFLTYLIFNSQSYLRDTSSFEARVFPQGKTLPDEATWSTWTIHGLVLPLGFLLGIAIAVLVWILYSRTRFGFEVQVIGDSPRAGRYAGMRTRRKILAVMCLSGAIAGIGGASQDGDFRHQLDPRGLQAAAYGYTGIVIAALARYNPLGVVVVAFVLGGLQNAGYTLQGADFPAGLVGVMQGLILFCALGGELFVRYRVRFARTTRSADDSGAGAGAVNNSLLVVVLASGVLYGTPLLYAALGELLAERSGVLNLGVEGMMLVGAVMGFWAVQRVDVGSTASLAAGLAVAALAGAAMALIHAFLVITLRANQIVSGLALTIFAGAVGLSSYLGNDLKLSGVPARHQFDEVFPKSWQDLPVVGPIIFGQSILVYASWILVAIVALYLTRTRTGLNVRAVGESPAAADAMGVNVAGTATLTRSSAARSPGSAARRSASRSPRNGRTA